MTAPADLSETIAAATGPEADLAAWAARSDAAAIERCLAWAAPRAVAQASRTLGAGADADDAAQEALVQLCRTAARFDPSRPLAPWLATLVRTACERVRRSASRRRSHEREAAAQPTPTASPVADGELVRAAVAELPTHERVAVELHYFSGLSQDHAASALGVSANALAVRLHRAREKLRDLLVRRGVAAMAIPAMLTATGAEVAANEGALSLAQVVTSRALSGDLPRTTIPLGVGAEVGWWVSTHTLATILAASLVLAGCAGGWWLSAHRGEASPSALSVAGAPPPEPKPTLAEQPWQGRSGDLLRFLDPQAPIQCAIDLDYLRRVSPTVKPTSLFADPRCATLVAAWESHLRLGGVTMLAHLTVIAPPHAVGGVISAYPGNPFSAAAIADLSPEGTRAVFSIDGGPGWPKNIIPDPAEGGFSGASSGGVFQGFDGVSRFAITPTGWMGKRLAGKPAPPPPAAAWTHIDMSALFPDSAPRLDSRLSVRDGVWCHDGAAHNLPALFSSFVMAHAKDTPAPVLPATPRLRSPDASRLPPAPTGCWAELRFALDPTTLIRNGSRFLIDVHGWEPLDDALRAGWTGDLLCVVEPGAPLPAITVVLGMRDRQTAAAVASAGATLANVTPAADNSWQWFTPAGVMTCRAEDDRLVLTTRVDPAFSRAPGPANAPAVHLTMDLPAAARVWLPVVWGQLAAVAKQNQIELPPVGVVIEHLPTYELTVEAKGDDWTWQERGLPLLSVVVGGLPTMVALQH